MPQDEQNLNIHWSDYWLKCQRVRLGDGYGDTFVSDVTEVTCPKCKEMLFHPKVDVSRLVNKGDKLEVKLLDVDGNEVDPPSEIELGYPD